MSTEFEIIENLRKSGFTVHFSAFSDSHAKRMIEYRYIQEGDIYKVELIRSWENQQVGNLPFRVEESGSNLLDCCLKVRTTLEAALADLPRKLEPLSTTPAAE